MTWVGLQVGEDVLEPLVEGLMVVVHRDKVVSYVVDGGLKFKAMFAKFVDLIRDKRNVRLLVEVDGLFLLALLNFDSIIQGLLSLGCSCPSLRRRCHRRLAGSTRFLGRHDERGDRKMGSNVNDRRRRSWGRNERYKEKLAMCVEDSENFSLSEKLE